jgi:hypothetical protein
VCSCVLTSSRSLPERAYTVRRFPVQIIKNSDDLDDVEFASPVTSRDHPGAGGTDIFSSRGQGVPLSAARSYTDTPTWLQATSHLRKHPAQVHMDTMSFHLLDQGFGTHTLLTVRQLDNEKQRKLTLEQQSRAGVLGRIVSGVWVKLAQVHARPVREKH